MLNWKESDPKQKDAEERKSTIKSEDEENKLEDVPPMPLAEFYRRLSEVGKVILSENNK